MDKIKQKDVVSLIAGIIVPHHIDKKTAHNNIRGHIARAVKNDELHHLNTLSDNIEFEHHEFWNWACTHWTQLLNHPEIPTFAARASLNTEISISVSATAYDDPDDYDELRSKYRAAQDEIMALEAKCAEKDARIKELCSPGRNGKKL